MTKSHDATSEAFEPLTTCSSLVSSYLAINLLHYQRRILTSKILSHTNPKRTLCNQTRLDRQLKKLQVKTV